MRVTYQHKVIARHLHDANGHVHGWPFSSPLEIEDELSRNEIHLDVGDYLVIDVQGGAISVGRAVGLQSLSAFGRNAMVIPYTELERAFHEQHVEWVEF